MQSEPVLWRDGSKVLVPAAAAECLSERTYLDIVFQRAARWESFRFQAKDSVIGRFVEYY